MPGYGSKRQSTTSRPARRSRALRRSLIAHSTRQESPPFVCRSRFRLRNDRPERAVGNPDLQRPAGKGLRYGTDRLPGGAVERDRVPSRQHGGRIEGRQLAAENIEVGSETAVPRVRFGACTAEKN